MTDLWLFTKLLFEVGMLCGFLPSILFVYAAEAWMKAQRPIAQSSGRAVSRRENRIQRRIATSPPRKIRRTA